MAEHIRGRTYLWVWLGLLVLALATFGLSFAPLGAASAWVALSIATAKAILIAAFFMHLVEQPSVSRWAFALGLVLAGILLTMVFLDVVTRDRPALRQPGVPAAAAGPSPDGTGN